MEATSTESSMLNVRRPMTFIATLVHTARIIEKRRIHVTMLTTGTKLSEVMASRGKTAAIVCSKAFVEWTMEQISSREDEGKSKDIVAGFFSSDRNHP